MIIRSKTVCVVGLGYIGLPTAALLAHHGYSVFGVDVDPIAVDTINRGQIHIVEPELDSFVQSAVESARLKAFLTPQIADIYMICVPTPFNNQGKIPTPDLSYVVSATRSIAPLIKADDIIILESTCPVGATHLVEKILVEENVDIRLVNIAYCPERVLPGKIMIELIENDRIIGGLSLKSTSVVAAFYKTFVKGKILETTSKTAEMCKLAENSFRDVNIAFANELSKICGTHEIDVWNLIRLANHHPRVEILSPGPGVGGHCIAVDPWFLVSGDPENAGLIQKGREVNDAKPDWVVSTILKTVKNQKSSVNLISKVKVACLGLTFKPDIDDLRESPAIKVARSLQHHQVEVLAVEPNIKSHSEFTIISLESALVEADIVVVLVKHKEFLSDKVKGQLRKIGAIDFCGALS